MKRDSKLQQILTDLYHKVYAELDVNIAELIESGVTKEEGWFMEYEMSNERQEEIMEEFLKGKRLSKVEKDRLRMSYWLGCSPKGI